MDVDSNQIGKSDDTATRQNTDVSLSKDNAVMSDMQEKGEETVEQDNKVSNNTLSQKIASAESEVNTTPSEGQKKAGNYKKGHVQIGSLNVTIEQPKSSGWAEHDRFYLEMVKEDEVSYNGLKKDVRYNRRTIEEGFGGIWIDNKQEFAKFVSAVKNYAFEEDGEGIAYTDNYFYAYYVNNENVAIPFARVFLNAEESQSVVTQVIEELQDVGTHERIKEYFNRSIERAWHIQNADNGDDGNNSSLPNRRRVGKLDSNLLRKGKYYDRPSLYVKTQRADTRTGVVHENLDIRYSIRRKPAPKNVEKVYKLMRLGADKELYPLFIDAASPVKLGVWYDADSPNLEILKRLPEGVFLVDYENGTYESLSDYAQRTGEKVGKFPSVRSVNEATNAGLRWVEQEKVQDWLGIADLNRPIHTNNPELISVANVIESFENPNK